MSTAFAMYAALYAVHYDKGKIVYRAWWFVMIASSVGQVSGTALINFLLLHHMHIKNIYLICGFSMFLGIIVIIFCPGKKKVTEVN